MYNEYLRLAYDIYKKVEEGYPRVHGFGNRMLMCRALSRKLDIALGDVEAISIIIENAQSEIFKQKSVYIREHIEKLIEARTQKDIQTITEIYGIFRTTFNMSNNTMLKYIKIVVFEDAVTLYGNRKEHVSPFKAFLKTIEEDGNNDQDKLEESVGKDISDKTKELHSNESINSEESDTELLRKKLVAEILCESSCACSMPTVGLLTRFINRIKKFFSGK